MFADKFTETVPHFSRRTAFVAGVILACAFLAGSFPAEAGRPKAPENFRVTAVTAYTVSVAWNTPHGSSGSFNYYLSGTSGVTPVVLPSTATTYTFTFLHPGNQYWFFIYARAANGDGSQTVSVTTRTLLDTTPPSTAPNVTVNEVGSNYAAISWTVPLDDSPYFTYEVWVNGNLYTTTGRNITSTVLRFLTPATGYAITVRGRDDGNNYSPFSNPVSITTPPPNPNDHTPPTTPSFVTAYDFGDGSAEMQVQWAQSTDNIDVQANIRYDVYVNGSLEDIRFGTGGPITVYGQHGQNTIQVTASDTAGNAAEPATTTLFIQ